LPLHGGFIVCRKVTLDFLDVVVGIGQRIVDVGRSERRVLLDDLFYAHALTVTGQNCGNADTGLSHDWLPSTARGIFLDISIVQSWHVCYPTGPQAENLDTSLYHCQPNLASVRMAFKAFSKRQF
jgi:hypothetical protein